MAPLGLENAVREPDTPPPSNPALHYLNGHTIAPEFYPMYEKLGADMVGKPLTEEKLNLIRKRHEQYFENLGFYRIEGHYGGASAGVWQLGMPGQVPGGLVAVAKFDRYLSYIDPVFQGFVTQYGADMTGFALTGAFASSDGKWEQILENVVLVADSRIDPQSVTLRPLSEKVHIMVEEPRSQGSDPEMYFYPVTGEQRLRDPALFLGLHPETWRRAGDRLAGDALFAVARPSLPPVLYQPVPDLRPVSRRTCARATRAAGLCLTGCCITAASPTPSPSTTNIPVTEPGQELYPSPASTETEVQSNIAGYRDTG